MDQPATGEEAMELVNVRTDEASWPKAITVMTKVVSFSDPNRIYP